VDDVFSTYLYTGNGSTQTITNGIDLAGEGGLVWLKERSAADIHNLYDTNRGATYLLKSNDASDQTAIANSLTSFNANGFSLGDYVRANESSQTYVSWTFRKAPKFFDVVTYTGTGVNRTVAHNLGSVPGMMIVKRTDLTVDWQVYHRANTANPETDYLVLNSTATTADSDTRWNDTLPTASVFSLGTEATVNASGGSYVAYLFAHDAGGFGESGTDNAVSCGSYTGTGASGNFVSLGYEPQWVMVKRAVGGTSHWYMLDTMRGIVTGGNDPRFQADQSDAEFTEQDLMSVTATGFELRTDGAWNISGSTYIYLAIRRPNKPPTSGTQVFAPFSSSVTYPTTFSTNFVTDAVLTGLRNDINDKHLTSRLTGGLYMNTNSTAIEDSISYTTFASNTSFTDSYWRSGFGFIQFAYGLRRAPGFFDVVCYTGTGANRTVAHNLTVAPELIIFKARSIGYGWWTAFGFNSPGFANEYSAMYLESNGGAIAGLNFFNYDGNYLRALPNASNIQFGSNGDINQSGITYVAYLFATLPGISKVGSYTGTGTTLQINCGFTTGARFVLIKATSTTGNWLVWDAARGIISGNDPYLALNSTAAEVTNTDWVDPLASGFELSNVGGNLANTNAVSYIFLAVA
jgi:hypothetical protein